MNEKRVVVDKYFMDELDRELEAIKQEINEHSAKRATQNISREQVRVTRTKFIDDFGWLLDNESDKEK